MTDLSEYQKNELRFSNVPSTGIKRFRRVTDLIAIVCAIALGAYLVMPQTKSSQVDISNIAFTTYEVDQNLSPRERYIESRAELRKLADTTVAASLAVPTDYYDQIAQSGTAFLQELHREADYSFKNYKARLQARPDGWTPYERALLTFEEARRDYFSALLAERTS